MFAKQYKFLTIALGLVISCAANAGAVDNLLRHSGDPVAGNPNGKITVVEFFDYQCSHCANMAPIMADIIQANPDVRIVFKDLPIRGPMSELGAKAAVAANKQGKYMPFNHALFSADSITNDSVAQLAKDNGLNVTQFKKDLNSSATKNQIKSNIELAGDLNINGTPAFFIGATNAKDVKELNFVLGEMSQSELQGAIDKAKK